MQSTTLATGAPAGVAPSAAAMPAERISPRNVFPGVPIAIALAIAAFALFPPVRGHARLTWTFLGVAGVMLGWIGVLWALGKSRGRKYALVLAPPVKSHYVQAIVHSSIYAYWGWYWPKVYEAVPLIAAQIVFLYLFDALLSWSRGRGWRLGFGVFPIVFSTNLFLWFKDDWFVFQFAMIASCALAKEFLRWNRDGRSTHIFNPSAFGLSLVSVILIATQTTQLTWGIEVATTLGRPPHIFLWIFLVGLIVQYFFAVTLMTVAAVATLYVMNVVYTSVTGVYYFVDTNIPIAVFLGMHLLVTDPATSPRTSSGRILFGILYGIGNWVLFTMLGNMNVPDFYDKLLPVPILNLTVRIIDRYTRSSLLEHWASFSGRLNPKRLNLANMGAWIALFAVMLSTGFVDAPHPGGSIAFWRQAYDEGKPYAGRNWMKMVGASADSGNPESCNQLGLIYIEGEIVPQNRRGAAYYFALASRKGHLGGSENVVWQFLTYGEAEGLEDLERAFAHLAQAHRESKQGRAAYLLGRANEIGRGRPMSLERALNWYRESSSRGNLDAAKALGGLLARGSGASEDLGRIAPMLESACQSGDAEACLQLARALGSAVAGQPDVARADALMQRACDLGSPEACAALGRPVIGGAVPTPGATPVATERR